jgi:hypothetical protein
MPVATIVSVVEAIARNHRRWLSEYFSRHNRKRAAWFFIRLLGNFIFQLLQGLLLAYIIARILKQILAGTSSV